jgi:hypothetical protein
MAKQRTVTGAYSAGDVNKHNKDRIRNVEIGPAAGMRDVKSYASAIDGNSGFHGAAGKPWPIKVGAGTVLGKVDPHGTAASRERTEFLPKRSRPGARWERG